MVTSSHCNFLFTGTEKMVIPATGMCCAETQRRREFIKAMRMQSPVYTDGIFPSSIFYDYILENVLVHTSQRGRDILQL